MKRDVPKMLILGNVGEDPFLGELQKFLQTKNRATCEFAPKDNRDLTRKAEDFDFVAMEYRNKPAVDSKYDQNLIRDLPDTRNKLLLFSDDNGLAFKTLYKDYDFRQILPTNEEDDWGQYLLQEFLDWGKAQKPPDRIKNPVAGLSLQPVTELLKTVKEIWPVLVPTTGVGGAGVWIMSVLSGGPALAASYVLESMPPLSKDALRMDGTTLSFTDTTGQWVLNLQQESRKDTLVGVLDGMKLDLKRPQQVGNSVNSLVDALTKSPLELSFENGNLVIDLDGSKFVWKEEQ